MNMILCGLPKCGKTTIGKALALKLEWSFVDSDSLIENFFFVKTGKKWTCRTIFQQEGETSFRQLEKEQIHSLIPHKKSVIALGGGSLMDPDNVRTLQSIGSIIYLKTSVDVLWKRISSHEIPSYLDPVNPQHSFHLLAKKRVPVYEKAAETIFDTTHLSEDKLVSEILNSRDFNNGK